MISKEGFVVFYFESLLYLFQNGKNCKDYTNGCYNCYEASCQVFK